MAVRCRSGWMRLRACLWLGLLGGSIGSTQAWASERVVEVTSLECPDLDSDELARLSELELGAAGGDGPAVRVEYLCAGEDVTIGMVSTSSNVRVERRVQGACCDAVDAERVLSLLSVGLFQAAVSEQLFDPAPQAGEPGPPEGATVVLPPVDADGQLIGPVPEETQAASVDASNATTEVPPMVPSVPPIVVNPGWSPPGDATGGDAMPSPAASASVHEIDAGATVGLHDPARPLVLYGGEASYRGFPWGRIGFGGFLGASFGRAARNAGSVDVRLFEAGALADFELVRADPFELRASPRLSFVFVQMQGDAFSPADEGGAEGATGAGRLRIEPRLLGPDVAIALPLEIGALLRAPHGLVYGDDAVVVDGLELSAGLAFSLGLGERTTAVREARR